MGNNSPVSIKHTLFLPPLTHSSVTVLRGQMLKSFIEDMNAESIRSARELWNKYAARKDLIDFKGNPYALVNIHS